MKIKRLSIEKKNKEAHEKWVPRNINIFQRVLKTK